MSLRAVLCLLPVLVAITLPAGAAPVASSDALATAAQLRARALSGASPAWSLIESLATDVAAWAVLLYLVGAGE